MNSRLVSLFVLVIAIGLFFSYVKPTWAEIQTLQTELKSDDTAMQAIKDFNAKKAELESKRSALDPEQLKKLEAMLPSSIDNVKDIIAIDALVKKSGLRLSNIDVSLQANTADANRTGKVTPMQSIDFVLTSQGTFTALNMFLESLERSQTIFDVRSLSVKGSNNGVYDYQLTIRTYWLR
jgi:hypothetical protein